MALAAIALAVPAQQRMAFGSDRGGLLLLSAELDGDAVRIRAENRLAGPVEARLVTARGEVEQDAAGIGDEQTGDARILQEGAPGQRQHERDRRARRGDRPSAAKG